MRPKIAPEGRVELVFDSEAKMPPSNIEAEEAILGGLLLDPRAIERIAETLPPEAFYVAAHGKIYAAAIALYREGSPTDLIQISTRLADMGVLEEIGGVSRVGKLVESTISAVNIDQYAELVLDKWTRRKLIQVMSEGSYLAFDRSTPLKDLLGTVEQKVFSLTQFRARETPTPISEVLVGVAAEIEDRASTGIPPGISCGFYDLDAMTQGFQRGNLILAAGRPAMGKTAFVVNVARNIAVGAGLPVAVFSLEMSKQQLLYRLLSAEAQIESGRLRSGRVSEREWEPLGQAIAALSHMPIFIDDTPDTSVSDIRSKVRRLKAEQGELGAVILDYLQLMDGAGDNRVEDLSKITRQLKLLARELDVPVIALSQLNRGVESRANKRPMLSDLRESGSQEQDADLVLMLYRDEYYNPDTPDRGIAEVAITKQRNGPTGTVKLLFEGEFTRFRNLARSANG